MRTVRPKSGSQRSRTRDAIAAIGRRTRLSLGMASIGMLLLASLPATVSADDSDTGGETCIDYPLAKFEGRLKFMAAVAPLDDCFTDVGYDSVSGTERPCQPQRNHEEYPMDALGGSNVLALTIVIAGNPIALPTEYTSGDAILGLHTHSDYTTYSGNEKYNETTQKWDRQNCKEDKEWTYHSYDYKVTLAPNDHGTTGTYKCFWEGGEAYTYVNGVRKEVSNWYSSKGQSDVIYAGIPVVGPSSSCIGSVHGNAIGTSMQGDTLLSHCDNNVVSVPYVASSEDVCQMVQTQQPIGLLETLTPVLVFNYVGTWTAGQ